MNGFENINKYFLSNNKDDNIYDLISLSNISDEYKIKHINYLNIYNLLFCQNGSLLTFKNVYNFYSIWKNDILLKYLLEECNESNIFDYINNYDLCKFELSYEDTTYNKQFFIDNINNDIEEYFNLLVKIYDHSEKIDSFKKAFASYIFLLNTSKDNMKKLLKRTVNQIFLRIGKKKFIKLIYNIGD